MIHISMVPDIELTGRLPAEQFACGFVDIQSLDPAPSGELLRLDYSPHGEASLSADDALACFCDFLKLFVGGGKAFAIRHDLANASVVLSAVPTDANEGPLGHGGYPMLAEAGVA